jgi:hypothetical protein
MTNPLKQYFRTPKLYVKLPSLGQYNDESDIEFAPNHEVGVYPLTAIDQLMLKTPDALLNGETLFKIIQSCVPAVKNVKNLTQPDITAVIIGIRIASHGNNFEFKCTCPSCSHENEVGVDLTHFIDTAATLPPDKTISIDDNLVVYVKPYTFEQRNLQLINEFDQNKAVRALESDDSIPEHVKLKKVSELIENIAERTFAIVANSVEKVFIESSKTVVTDRNHLIEFLQGISKSQADAIIQAISELNDTGVNQTAELQCEKCQHQWTQPIDFDPTSFFD